MFKRKIIYILYFVCCFTMGQQSMQEGFQLLETGDFKAAKVFFKSYLDNYPKNKTANICYGRALGLSGNPLEANTLFNNLVAVYPNDFEVKLNYYESFLWAKKYEEAKPLYKKMLIENSDNFAANLGYANTLSNLKEYPQALAQINKTIALDTVNKSAKISRKYILLGYANMLVNKQNYKKGKELLIAIFKDFSEDKEALLNLANLYLIKKETDKAIQTYSRLIKTPEDSITALNGIALAHHIAEKDKNALDVAMLSMDKVKNKEGEIKERSQERYVQALIWNRKFKKAEQQIAKLSHKHTNRNWVLGLKATLSMYKGDFKESIKSYDAILKNDSVSFDGNLGKANALFANGNTKLAYKGAYNTLSIYKNQKDALAFIKKLNLMHTPSIEEHFAYTFDNGNNIAFYTTTTTQFPLATKFSANFSYQYRTTENTVTNNKANSHIVLGGFSYKILPKITFKSIVGINISSYNTTSYSQPVLDLRLKTKPLKLQHLEIGYQREVQNFNADLIQREIVMNHYGVNYNLATNINLGWYTQFMYTQQSDANERNLFFTSLYYSMFKKPIVKLGFNYQYIGFAAQVPTIYFSPEKYNVMELFAEVRGTINKKTNYLVSMAAGSQQIVNNDRSTVFRAETSLQHQFTERFSGNIYGKYSNIASVTASGFEFTEIGFKLKWLLTKKPLFYKKIKN